MPNLNQLSSEPISAAIIGAGAVGGYHIKAQTELGSRITVYEPNQVRAQSVADTYGVKVVDSFEKAAYDADVVHICTPPMDHMSSALASIALGKPTIIEKPLAHDLDEAAEIYKAATAGNVPVVVGHHFRLTPPFLAIKEGIRSGHIGPLTSIATTYVHDMGKLQVGAAWRKELGEHGFMYEGAAHAVDLNVWLAAQPVSAVQATISEAKIRPEYLWREDLTLTLTYDDGTVGRVWANASAPLPEHGSSVEVYGGTGAYRAHNKYAVLDSYRDGEAGWVTTETEAVGQTIRPMASLFHSYIRGESDQFAPLPDIGEALGVMVVLDTLETAARSGSVERVPTLQEVLAR